MCVSRHHPPTRIYILLLALTHSCACGGRAAALTSPPTPGKGWERQPRSLGLCFCFFLPHPPKRGGSPPLLVRKAAGRWELATSTAPCQTHLREINYGMESAQSLWDVPLPSTGPPGLGIEVGGDPSEGGRVGGAGTQVGAGKMALEKVVELVMGPNRLEKNHNWGSWWD